MEKSNTSGALRVDVAPFGEIMNERPEGMSFDEYRKKRKEQCMKLRGYNITVMDGGMPVKKHVTGRLEGILIPSAQWTNSRNVVVVIG